MLFLRNAFFLLFCFFCLHSLALGQNEDMRAALYSTADSLKQVAKDAKEDTTRLAAYQSLAELYGKLNYDTAILYWHQLRANTQEAKKKAFVSYKLGVAFVNTGQYDSSSYYSQQAIRYAEKQGDSTLLVNALSNSAIPLLYQSKFEEAIPVMQHTLSCAIAIQDTATISTLYNNLAAVHFMLEDTLLGLAQMLKSLQIERNQGTQISTAIAAQNLAGIYENIGKPDSATLLVEEALALHEEIGVNRYYPNALHVRAKLYLYAEENPRDAIRLLDKAMGMMEELNLHSNLADVLITAANAYLKQGNTALALSLAEKAAKESEKHNEKSGLANVLDLKYSLLKQLGRYREALATYEDAVEIRKEIFNAEKSKQIKEMEAKYENAKIKEEMAVLGKEKEIQDLELKRKNEQLFYGFIALGVFVVLLIGVLRANHLRRRANVALQEKNEEILQQKEEITRSANNLKMANAEILQQKEEIQAQAENLREINEQISETSRALSIKNKQVTDSIRYASTIQHAVLPWEDRLRQSFEDFFIFFKPLHIVSGDFYWLDQLADGRKYLAVADCTGHGVPGAFMSMLGTTFLGEILDREQIKDPAQILEHLDQRVRLALQQEKGQNDDGMDVCLIEVLPAEGDEVPVFFVGAKRPLFYHDGEALHVLRGSRRSIGGSTLRRDKAFESHALRLKKGTMLYLTSDGYMDQLSPARKKFSTPRFKALLEEISSLPIAAQHERLDEALAAHQQECTPIDDITILGIKL